MQKILITGIAGTIGSALINKFSKFENTEIVGIDSDKKNLNNLKKKYKKYKNIFFYNYSINNLSKLNTICKNINIIYHAAAIKDVVLAEENPNQTIKSNLYGIQNLIKSSILNNVNKVLFCSSDKAVNPSNVMGASKLIGEKLFLSANYLKNNAGTIFSCVRFGNVIGSSGSFLPIFYNQILNSEKLTITHKNMTRFIMSVDQAVKLLIKCSKEAKGGEIFVSKMDSIKIVDAANVINKIYGNNKKNYKKYTGIREGEKLFEELISAEELTRVKEFEHYFVIFPKKYNNQINIKKINTNKIKSDLCKHLSKDQIKNILKKTYPLK